MSGRGWFFSRLQLSLCGFETTKERGSFSVQEFASNSDCAFVLLVLNVLYFIILL